MRIKSKNQILTEVLEYAGVRPEKVLGEDAFRKNIDEGSDFSTNRRAKFQQGWQGVVSEFLQMVGFILVEHLTERGYSTYGAKVQGASLWVKFEGDTSLPYAGGEFAIYINMEHKLSPSLTVKANRGDDKKSGAVKAPSGLSGMKIFSDSPQDVANEILFRGTPSWGDRLGVYD